jgi:endonuclease VIII-like 1
MPEAAEIMIMRDYINEVSADKIFFNIRKSTVSKVKAHIYNPFDSFTIEAFSRGKELKIDFSDGKNTKCMCFSMGMSGNWNMTKTGAEMKHTHFMIDSVNGETLGLVDTRRFAKWKWTNWNYSRGYDIVADTQNFLNYINNITDEKLLNLPLYQILMNQSIFSGVGNYLRAEILYRNDINPFVKFKEVNKNNKFLLNIKDIILEAYYIGGGELKDWKNPFRDNEEIKFEEWLQCYGKKEMETFIDESGRKLWYNKKWNTNNKNI